MEIQSLTEFFKWCTVINGALLVIFYLILTLGQNWVYRMHSRLFPMKRETFTVVIYSFLGFYKIIFIAFNLIPYIALEIMKG